MAWARDGGSPQKLAAARDTVFRRYLPMARTLANAPSHEFLSVDPVRAEQAAELGLAQAVLGWRRPDSGGFELFASIAVAAQLDRIPANPLARTGVGRQVGNPPSATTGDAPEKEDVPAPLPGRGHAPRPGRLFVTGKALHEK